MSITTTAQPPAGAPLRADYPALPMFGWLFLAGIGQALIVPSPWTLTAAYRFLCRNVSLPDGRRLRFAGQPGDIWYVIVGLGLVSLFMHSGHHVHGLGRSGGAALHLVHLAAFLVNAWLTVLVIGWFVANVKTEDGQLSVRFAGSAWGYIGWQLLLILSFVTIIGWAWVAKFFIRWICRNVTGNMSFDFVASGWQILWRSVVFVLVCCLIIPIPWMMRWLGNWHASQIVVTAG